jgi:hypothetical protein
MDNKYTKDELKKLRAEKEAEEKHKDAKKLNKRNKKKKL